MVNKEIKKNYFRESGAVEHDSNDGLDTSSPKVELQPLPEQGEPTSGEKSGGGEKEGAGKKTTTPVHPRHHKPLPPSSKDEVAVKIEKVLEEGLNDSFQRLSPVAKEEFKIRGEETAVKIRVLLSATHVKIKKIFTLILNWLKLLPGINKFFLIQEAKIKADKILALKK